MNDIFLKYAHISNLEYLEKEAAKIDVSKIKSAFGKAGKTVKEETRGAIHDTLNLNRKINKIRNMSISGSIGLGGGFLLGRASKAKFPQGDTEKVASIFAKYALSREEEDIEKIIRKTNKSATIGGLVTGIPAAIGGGTAGALLHGGIAVAGKRFLGMPKGKMGIAGVTATGALRGAVLAGIPGAATGSLIGGGLGAMYEIGKTIPPIIKKEAEFAETTHNMLYGGARGAREGALAAGVPAAMVGGTSGAVMGHYGKKALNLGLSAYSKKPVKIKNGTLIPVLAGAVGATTAAVPAAMSGALIGGSLGATLGGVRSIPLTSKQLKEER